jgi:translation initiation factor 2 alpha subunit (eIF-2alpha)
MKDYKIQKFPADKYNDMYAQIQYEMMESIKTTILNFNQINSQIKQDLIEGIEEQIKDDQLEIRRMIELSNFQYNIRENRKIKNNERTRINAYKLDYDYGFKPEIMDDLY